MASEGKKFEVELIGAERYHGTFVAATASKARYLAFRALREVISNLRLTELRVRRTEEASHAE